MRRLLWALTTIWSAAASAIPEGPTYPSAAWTQREASNYAIAGQASTEQASNPDFLAQWQMQGLANQQSWISREATDPSWLSPTSGNTPMSPVCTQWSQQCTGDPFRYPGTDPFYDSIGEITPVVFYDSGCARLSGRVWKPKKMPANSRLPGIVIETGSIEAPETLYWWAAQTFVRNGYVVMTFDVRGQGRSDFQTPSGSAGTDINPSVFWTDLVDAIDFFRSTPQRKYPNNVICAGTYPTTVVEANPYSENIDPDRLGIAGHSSGAIGASVVQGYGSPDALPWPGKIDKTNPVKAIVAWDGLFTPDGGGGGGANGTLPIIIATLFPTGTLPKVGIRVPAMDIDSEYGVDPIPYTTPPDPENNKVAYKQWKAAGIPVYGITIQGSTHFDFSLAPTFPTSSWCPQTKDNQCVGGWGNPMAQYYSLAWFDRWLKQPGESGYADADRRLLDDGGVQGSAKMSFYSRSARSMPDRAGLMHNCEDIRASCSDTALASNEGISPSPSTKYRVGSIPADILLVLLFAKVLRRAKKR